MNCKRGELTSEQIIVIVLAIAGFVVVLLFFPIIQPLFTEQTSDELCHLSVITRATAPDALQSGVPLKCETKKVCISESGRGDACSQFLGEEGVRVVELSGSVEDKAKVIERESANAMYDCWRIMGEGKVSIFGKAFEQFTENQPKCVICSRVALADDVTQEVKNSVEINKYLAEQNVPGTNQKYLEAFGVSAYTFVDDVEFDKALEGIDAENRENIVRASNDQDQLAFVFMQLQAPGTIIEGMLGGAKTASFVLAGGAASTGTGRLAINPRVALAGVIAVGATAGFSGIQTYRNQLIAGAYCGVFEGKSQTSSGCSVVRGMEWDASAINHLCAGGIEGEL